MPESAERVKPAGGTKSDGSDLSQDALPMQESPHFDDDCA